MFKLTSHHIHFIGIGGIGMSGLAEVLLNLGCSIYGSDLNPSPITNKLQKLGATIYFNHQAKHVDNADVVVISSAIKNDNPEIIEARNRKIPVIKRAEMLAELMRLKYSIAVSGMHGKTTTTSLIATLLSEAGYDPTVVIGGQLTSIRSNAHLGQGKYFVAEADESDGSFLHLMPTIAVITNIDSEHLDHWTGGLPQITDAFIKFANKIPFYGKTVLCVDHPHIQSILPKIEKPYVTYGFSKQADYRAEDIQIESESMSFIVYHFNQSLGKLKLNMIGRHNVLNALAAIAVADNIGVHMNTISKALNKFEGIGRRFEIKGKFNNILIVDDYAHHPEEIKATLIAAKETYNRRLVVIFQPHRYTRTRDLLIEFSTCFNTCHSLFITDIYPAGENKIEGISSQTLIDSIKKHKNVHVLYAGPIKNITNKIYNYAKEGDLILTLGAGSIGSVSDDLIDIFKSKNKEKNVSNKK